MVTASGNRCGPVLVVFKAPNMFSYIDMVEMYFAAQGGASWGLEWFQSQRESSAIGEAREVLHRHERSLLLVVPR